jgi:hypothetical protein
MERMEALLRGDAPRTQAEERRSALLGELRGTTLRAPEALRTRVLATAPAQRQGFALRRPSWRLALVVLPATLAVAVVAALVHGFTGSDKPVSLGRPTVMRSDRADTNRRAIAPAWKQAKPFGAASGPGANSAQTLQAAPAAGTSGRLTHTDASLTVSVPNTEKLREATNAATRIASSLGGFAQSVVYRTPQKGGGASYIELRIPAQNVQRALTQIATLGTLVSQEVSVQDLQHDLAVQSEQIAQLRRRVASLQKALQSQALPEAQRVLLQIKLAESKRSLAQRLQARKGTIAAGTTSRVSLVLSTHESAVVPVQRGRLDRMLRSAVGFLALEATVALYALIVISPVLVLAALVWVLTRLRRRRDELRLLTS